MRKLDGKFELKDNQVVKISNGEVLPEDEPLFIFRARDYLAVPTLFEYLRLCENDGATSYQISGIKTQILQFQLWRDKNKDKMKQPGVTKGL
jgi:hypothetical protein